MKAHIGRFFTVSFFLLSAVGCRASLDGAWEGQADCEDTGTHTLSALFNEQDDGDLQGHFYVENIDFLGAELTLRADIDDGEYDPDDNEYRFDLQGDDDGEPEFSGSLEIDDQDPDEVSGDLEQFEDDGDVAQRCSFELDRLSRAD